MLSSLGLLNSNPVERIGETPERWSNGPEADNEAREYVLQMMPSRALQSVYETQDRCINSPNELGCENCRSVYSLIEIINLCCTVIRVTSSR
jgi:hypothetical protein